MKRIKKNRTIIIQIIKDTYFRIAKNSKLLNESKMMQIFVDRSFQANYLQEKYTVKTILMSPVFPS